MGTTSAPLAAAIPRPPAVGFVARGDEEGRDIVERLKGNLDPAQQRLVVLWGPGGVGKTTLAAEAVREMAGVFGKRTVWAGAQNRPTSTSTRCWMKSPLGSAAPIYASL